MFIPFLVPLWSCKQVNLLFLIDNNAIFMLGTEEGCYSTWFTAVCSILKFRSCIKVFRGAKILVEVNDGPSV